MGMGYGGQQSVDSLYVDTYSAVHYLRRMPEVNGDSPEAEYVIPYAVN